MSVHVSVIRTRNIKSDVRPAQVNVPVKTNIWVRPECQRLQFEAIKNARPSALFLQSDGGRNEREWELIRQNRTIFEEEIDWDCTVHFLYADENLGMYTMGAYTRDYIWNEVDRCIFMEDDHVPSVSFFRFCAEMLERYKDDLRVCCICGMNHLGKYEGPNSDYFFSHVGSIWGIAMWKRTAESPKLEYKDDPYVIDRVCEIAKKDTYFCKSMRGYAEGELVGGHVPGSEFFLCLDMFAQNQLLIIPRENMISCLGATGGSAHATDSLKKMAKGAAQIFNMATYELPEQIRHPLYVFPDLTYERKLKRVMAWHHPLISFYRGSVGIIKRLYYGDGLIMLKKIPVKVRRMLGKEYEK